jgi:hypothetical protein
LIDFLGLCDGVTMGDAEFSLEGDRVVIMGRGERVEGKGR